MSGYFLIIDGGTIDQVAGFRGLTIMDAFGSGLFIFSHF